MLVHLDFETFSEADLKTVGSYAYAEHPSTEVLCLAWSGPDGERLWIPDVNNELLAELEALATGWYDFVAHNASFEQPIWHHQMVRKWGMPELPPSRWQCTLAASRYRALPGALERAASALRLPLNKDREGALALRKLMKPRKPTKNDRSTRTQDPAGVLISQVAHYCQVDVRVEEALEKSVGLLPAKELAVWRLDQRVNQRGVGIDVASAQRCLNLYEQCAKSMLAELPKITDDAITTPNQIARIQKFLHSRGVHLDDLAADTLEELDFDRVEEVGGFEARRVLEIRRYLGKSSLKKLTAMVTVPGSDGRARGLLQYYGADTGRWAGRLIQPQNLARPLFDIEDPDVLIDIIHQDNAIEIIEAMGYDVPEFLVTCIRALIVAQNGADLAACDFTSIESVVLFSMAGDQDKMDMLRSGRSLYLDLANQIYGRDIDKAKDLKEYTVGKIGILGLGYGMGPRKYRDTVKKQGGVEISMAEAETVVKEKYRVVNPLVTKLWYGMEQAAVAAVAYPGTDQWRAGVRWRMSDDRRWLNAWLPSGRPLHYFDPRVEPTMTPWGEENLQLSYMSFKMGQWARTRTYGGKLVENVVQAVARDLMVGAMLKMEAEGMPLVLTVHDEVVQEAVNPDVKAMEQIMADVPDWARGWPVSAHGWAGKRYRK